MKVLFHVQHLLGLGHLKRAELLTTAMAEAGLEVTVALGGAPLAAVPFAAGRVAELPPARIAGEDFATLLDAAGRPVDEAWRERRRAALLDLLHTADPDVVLVELFPFGRRQFRFELVPLLEAAQAMPRAPKIAVSVRDVLVAPKRPGRAEEAVATLRRFFDAVLVHGDPKLVPFERTFPAAAEIADLIRYTGYVAAAPKAVESEAGAGEVLVSAGGGAVGAPLLRAALAARKISPLADRTWRLIAGPNLPEPDYAELQRSAPPDVVVERFRNDFPARLATCALSISQAGYNTTLDVLTAGARAVLVPYETPGETEQRLRAELFAERGLLTLLPAAALSPDSLAAAIAAALAKPKPPSAGIDLGGAATTAALVRRLAEARGAAEAPDARRRLPDD
jgi:predicted glycosyltransferase